MFLHHSQLGGTTKDIYVSKLALSNREVTLPLPVLFQTLLMLSIENMCLSPGSMASLSACQIQQPSPDFLSGSDMLRQWQSHSFY